MPWMGTRLSLPARREGTARLQEILCNRIKTPPPAAHLIGIERRGLRWHPDNHQFSFRVDANELPVDAERDQHAVIAVDAPIVSFARLTCAGNRSLFSEG